MAAADSRAADDIMAATDNKSDTDSRADVCSQASADKRLDTDSRSDARNKAGVDIICKPARDTFVRLGIMLLALAGFGLYFFYDGSIGYPRANEVYLSHRAFAELGRLAAEKPLELPETSDAALWRHRRSTTPLFPVEQEDGRPVAKTSGGDIIPLPRDLELTSCPEETHDLDAMSRDWSACWAAFTASRGLPLKPAEHPYTTGSIREQYYAGAGCLALALILALCMLRLSRRRVELHGDTLLIGGQSVNIADISCIDLRQWGKGFKGFARLTVKGRSIKFDGMTYGGFDPKQGEPAEALMQAVLARYKGDIIEYGDKADQSR